MSSAQQREELHRTIWNIADELRGAVGGWEFEAYILGTLFYSFISENLNLLSPIKVSVQTVDIVNTLPKQKFN